eukprot:5734093-Pyramimonas_sp.AAC.2
MVPSIRHCVKHRFPPDQVGRSPACSPTPQVQMAAEELGHGTGGGCAIRLYCPKGSIPLKRDRMPIDDWWVDIPCIIEHVSRIVLDEFAHAFREHGVSFLLSPQARGSAVAG